MLFEEFSPSASSLSGAHVSSTPPLQSSTNHFQEHVWGAEIEDKGQVAEVNLQLLVAAAEVKVVTAAAGR